MAERRRLPVIQSAPPGTAGSGSERDDRGGTGAPKVDDATGERPSWHWIGFGTVAIFACWLPLAYLAEAARHRFFTGRFGPSPSRDQVDLAFAAMTAMERFSWTLVQTLPHVLAFAVSAFVGGLLVGRFGTRAGPREAAASGAVTALIALAVSWRVLAESGWAAALSMAVPLVLAVGFAGWGGLVGARRRRNAEKMPPDA